MKKLFISFAIVIFSISAVKAQSAAKSIYFELGGPGLVSFNYDQRLQKKEDGLGFRVGIGGWKVEDQSALFIPLGLNYLLGKDNRNYFEMGAGVTIVNINDEYTYDPYYPQDRSNFSTTFGHLYFGYRLQPKEGGFIFRAGITPVFSKHGFVPYLPAVSFGYKF